MTVLVRRLEPYFEPPSKAEDANSPVGPLQHHVAEPDFVEWENIDWAALSLGFDTEDMVYTPGSASKNVSIGIEHSINFNPATLGGANENMYDLGSGASGYGAVCSYYPSSRPILGVPNHPALFLLMNADDLGVHIGPAIQHPLPQWMKDEEHDF